MESACTKRDRYCSEPNCVLKFSWLFITLTYSQSFIYLVYWYIIKPDESSFGCFGIVLKYSDTSGFFNLKILKIKWRLLGVCMQQKKWNLWGNNVKVACSDRILDLSEMFLTFLLKKVKMAAVDMDTAKFEKWSIYGPSTMRKIKCIIFS